mgnify:CR=1 FL=1|jgi:fucose 4-O-acetylase-like acetyltransferase
MDKNRLHYIDVAKGLLILMVIFQHIYVIAGIDGYKSESLKDLGGISYFYIGFYMQAFFLLNGFTSNFNKPFKQFLIGSFKGLIIPYISFTIMFKLLDGICFGDWSLWKTVAQGDQIWFFLDESYWFLTALFLARLIYWPVNHYIKKNG